MAKFLFPTGRKSYFMAVIPLSRIQRLAVGNRGGREAGRGFVLLEDGTLRDDSPSQGLAGQRGAKAGGRSLCLRPEMDFL